MSFSQSFTEKLAGLMARPGQDNVPKDDIPWYIKYAGRALGIIGAFCECSFFCYLFNVGGFFVGPDNTTVTLSQQQSRIFE